MASGQPWFHDGEFFIVWFVSIRSFCTWPMIGYTVFDLMVSGLIEEDITTVVG